LIGASDWMQSTDEVSNNWKGMPNLESGKSYEVRLTVTNGISISTSALQTVKTRGVGKYEFCLLLYRMDIYYR